MCICKTLKISILKSLIVLVAIVCTCNEGIRGQDTHLSQMWISPITSNPAVAGFFEGTARIGGYYRTQWRAISKPYMTAGVYSDFALKKRPRQKDIFSMGVTLEYDMAGDSKFSTAQGNLILAYAHAINGNNDHFLMGGVSFGGVQRTWDYSQLKFDEQYIDGQYNPNVPLSEVFARRSFFFMDCAAGIQWAYRVNTKCFLSAGFSVYHLNMPRISLYKDDNIRMPILYSAQFNSTFVVQKSNELSPMIYYRKQAQYQELLFGLMYSYVFHFDSKWYINKFNFGIYHRWKDALFVSIGGLWRDVHFGLCYDFNVSKLSKASRARGSFEINVSYIIKTHHVPKPKSIPCYLF